MHRAQLVNRPERFRTLFGVEADSVDGSIAAFESGPNGGFVAHIGVELDELSVSPGSDLESAWMTSRDADRCARAYQLIHDCAAEKPGASKDGDAAHVHGDRRRSHPLVRAALGSQLNIRATRDMYFTAFHGESHGAPHPRFERRRFALIRSVCGSPTCSDLCGRTRSNCQARIWLGVPARALRG